MIKKKIDKNYFFVDESGDPFFYDRKGVCVLNKEGCSKLLILGFIMTYTPEILRKEIKLLQQEISKDDYLKQIPSFEKSIEAFHAKDDCPEIREKVFKKIIQLPFKAEVYVGRKMESIFKKRHQSKPNIFYDDLSSKLFQNKLHLASENCIYFAVRGNRARQKPMEEAILKAKLTFENKWNTKIDSQINIFPQRPESEFCLQIIDYVNWAIQRAYIKKEMRYFNFIKEKISLIADIYDFKKYPKNFYTKKNVFNINKISPL